MPCSRVQLDAISGDRTQDLLIRSLDALPLSHRAPLTKNVHEETLEIEIMIIIEPPHEITNNLQMRNQKQISFAVTAKLINAFVFTTEIVQFLYFLNPKFPASNHLLCLYSSVCVRPLQKPHCWFSNNVAQFFCDIKMYVICQ